MAKISTIQVKVPVFHHRYNNVPSLTVENPGGDYLVEDAGLLTDNKTRVEQMLLAGARLNELSKFYTYENVGPNKPIEEYEDTALTYGIDKLEMSEKLKQFEAGLRARLRVAERVKAEEASKVKEEALKSDKPAANAAGAENNSATDLK